MLFRRIVFASSLVLLTSIPLRVAAETSVVHVVGVTDGDTIKVLDSQHQQHKIRLAGIDAPEKKQPFGQRSKQNLSNLVFDRSVVLECGKIDRYRREICVVLIGGKDANLAQVAAGLAWWYRKYAREQTPQQRAAYEAAEDNARARRIGLWIDPAPVPPWDWRHRR